jgi:hypothetical protein
MSTPIDDIPDDVNDVQEDPYDKPLMTWNSGSVSKRRGYFSKYKEYVLVCIAVLLALSIPISYVRNQLPYQVFRFGDSPVRTVFVLVFFIILKQIASAF